jgi:hypothetical protein
VSTTKGQWATVARLLRQAGDIVRAEFKLPWPADLVPPGPLVGNLAEFEEFLSNNEFEIAWEALEHLAETHRATSEVWLLLARASLAMGLKSHTKRALKALERALAIPIPDDRRLVYQVRQFTGRRKGRWVTHHAAELGQGVAV